jgi:hypothetical protein
MLVASPISIPRTSDTTAFNTVRLSFRFTGAQSFMHLPRAAVHWHGPLETEARMLTLDESALAMPRSSLAPR